MGIERSVTIQRRKVEVCADHVNLFEFLKLHACEVYTSWETRCIEIRMPTRIDNYSHYVAHIPMDVVDMPRVVHQIVNNRHNEIFEEYIDHVVWHGDRDLGIVT